MKKRTFTSFVAAFVLAVLAVGAFAQQQVPDRFNYQAIVRDINGNVVGEQDVTIRMTFMDGATVVSTEDYTETTNEFGLINIAADLLPVEFVGTYYADPTIKIEIDLGDGSGFVDLGENDLQSVPYAMNAGNVATLSEGVLTVGSGETAVIPDATQVDANTGNITTLQGQVLNIESSITLMEGAIANHTTRIEALENAGFITNAEETDPVFSAHAAAGVTQTLIGNWNTAFGWDNHATAGYLTEEEDLLFVGSAAYGITSSDVQHWTTAHGWGNHNTMGYATEIWVGDQNYLTVETDPVFDLSPAASVTDSDIAYWNEAYGWGNHQPAIDGLQLELDNTQVGAGLEVDGSYPVGLKKSANYIGGASSLFNADELLDQAITDANVQITSNTTNIATNSSAIAANQAGIASNLVIINQNITDISNNSSLIATNIINIATNSSAIATNATAISTNSGLIATNIINIATNSSAIAANTAAISVNSGLIADNASDILAHGVLIAQNASDISDTQDELDVTQLGAGLDVDGTYLGSSMSSNYLTTASSLNNADMLLDAQVKINEDGISNNLTQIQTNAVNISSNASDIFSNYTLIDENTQWIFDEDMDTYITVEETADEDQIKMYVAGEELLRIKKRGQLEVLGESLFIGEEAGDNAITNTDNNIFIGPKAGKNTTSGANNVFIGYTAGTSNISGSNNLYLGNATGYFSTVGSSNTLLGSGSGKFVSSGAGNTFVGASSGMFTSTGAQNVYFGVSAGYSNEIGSLNVSIGANANYANENGSQNTVIGAFANYNNVSGNSNTLLGNYAGYANTDGSNNVFLGNRAGYYELESDKLYVSNRSGADEADGRDVALLYGDFSQEMLRINAQTTVTETEQAYENTNHTIGSGALVVDGGTYIYRDLFVNQHSRLDQTTIDVNDGEFLIHDGDGYTTPSMNGIMADVRGYIGLVSSIESGNAQLGVQTINETTRPTAAISVNAVVGGVDIQAGDDIYMDAQTVYINGVNAAKGTHMAVGIGTDDTGGNIHIGHDEGQRIINVGTYNAGGAYTDSINMGANIINTHTSSNTTILADADIDMDATNIYGDADNGISLDAGAASNFNTSVGNLTLGTASGTVDIDGSVNVEITANTGMVDVNGVTGVDVNASAGAINIGDDDVDQAINVGTDGVRNITIGSDAAAALVDINATNINLDAGSNVDINGANNVIVYATAALDMDGATTTLDGLTTIDIGTAAVVSPVNIGTSATARTITIGNAASTAVNVNALAITNTAGNGMILTAGTTMDIDGAITTIDGSTTIDIGTVNTGSPINIGTNGSRTIIVGSGAATVVDVNADLIDMDSDGAVQINGNAASNFTVAGANLTMQTTTTGEIHALSAGTASATTGSTQTGAIQLTAAAGGIDIAGANVAIDGTTGVYINGSSAKGTGVAVGIGTNSSNGNILIGTDGARDITIGNAAAETISMDGFELEVLSDSDITLTSGGTMSLTSAEEMALNSSKGFTIYGAETSSIKSGMDLTIDAAAILNLGTASATAINVGRAGITTNVLGALHVNEALSTASSLDVDGATTLDATTINTTDGTFLVEGSGVMDVDVDVTFKKNLTLGTHTVNAISNDRTLAAASTTALVTEYAAKTYTDSSVEAVDLQTVYDQSEAKTLYDSDGMINIAPNKTLTITSSGITRPMHIEYKDPSDNVSGFRVRMDSENVPSAANGITAVRGDFNWGAASNTNDRVSGHLGVHTDAYDAAVAANVFQNSDGTERVSAALGVRVPTTGSDIYYAGVFNGDVAVNKTATSSGAIILKRDAHQWKISINAAGELDFSTMSGTQWVSKSTMSK